MGIKKHFLVPFFLTCAVLQNPQAQEVAEVQQSLITKFTAMWNGECGTWSWALFESLRDSLPGKAVVLAAHVSGSYLQNQISLDWESNLGSADVPKFYLNDELQNVTSANVAAAFQLIEGLVEDNYQSAPLANVGLETAWNGDEIDIKTKVRFFQNGTGAFYLGLYLIEDHVMAAQAGFSGWVPHNGLLRTAVTPAPFGNLLVSGVVTAGTEFSKTYIASTSPYKLENLKVVGVIWKKEGSVYKAVNVWSIDAKPLIDATTEIHADPGIQATLWPNIFSGEEGIIRLQLKQAENLRIELIAGDGRVASLVFESRLAAGRHEISFDSSGVSLKGLHALRVTTAEGKTMALPFVQM